VNKSKKCLAKWLLIKFNTAFNKLISYLQYKKMLKTSINLYNSISLPIVKKIIIHTLFLLFLVLTGCGSSTQKILKSDDSNLKYTKALEWYNKGQYYKAIPVFEELMGVYKGSKTTEEIYYYYCMAQYKQGNYILSSFHFKNYVQQHPHSQYAEEALFMHAESFIKQSPKVELDQTETYNAIEAYQVFINQYPESERIADCNNKIDELRLKLETKALKAAKLYYKTENYRAAAFSFKNLLIDFPDIDNPEEIQFKVVKSFFKYADQSIVTKQQERYEEAIKVANSFASRYASSKYIDEVKSTEQESHYLAIKSAYRTALISNIENRDKKLKEVFEIYNIHESLIEDNKFKLQAEEVKEKTQFELIKTHFLQAQNLEFEKKEDYYVKTVRAYADFIDAYADSKYNKEATRIYKAAQKNLKKLNNG